MHKKLTITLDENVYYELHSVIGRGKISQFIENLVKPYVLNKELEQEYIEMAKDEEREKEAYEWIEGVVEDAYEER
jgi:predicted CopG family antitoxin